MESMTIYEAIQKIHRRDYVLPSIQREFVWKPQQTIMLFDSLMRQYPINTFLFWKVPKEKRNSFEFYEFIREYSTQYAYHNPRANIDGQQDIVAVLDGQQRLTSLYIALKGSYAYRRPYKKDYPPRRLYLNLLNESEDEDMLYDFKFLTDEESRTMDEITYWFPVGEILNMNEYDVKEYVQDKVLNDATAEEKFTFASETLMKLFTKICKEEEINYFLDDSGDLDKVLNIFVRVNSGGTQLSYSDLLLSFATAQWQNHNAREEISKFVDEANTIGNGFNISKDFVLKACLVLCDFNDIAFKIDNFNKDNMLQIEAEWERIMEVIRLSLKLIASFGFSKENLTSNNAIIPIAYYLFKRDASDKYIESDGYNEDRSQIKKWLVSSLLKRVFSYSPDGLLKPIREIINENHKEFPLEEIIEKFRGKNRNIIFSRDDINNLLDTKYGNGNAVLVMSILYHWADLKNNFHIDHIYPRETFKKKKLQDAGVENDVEEYISKKDCIGNLQFLEPIPNSEKSAKPYDEWLSERFDSKEELDNYRRLNLIPEMQSYNIQNFLDFIEKREKMIFNKLTEVLAVAPKDSDKNFPAENY